jgi:phosphoesterase RecJ-like protein
LDPALHHIAVALRRASSVVICGHYRPDGDSIGSVLGLALALREQGIAAIPTLADEGDPPKTYEWLPGFGLYVAAADLEVPAVFVSLDCPNPERLGVARTLAGAAETLVVMDHHPDAQPFGGVNALNPRAAATGQMVWHLLRALDVEPSDEVALCLYTALLTDTGRFSYQNTTPESLRDAAEMIEAGADPVEAAKWAYQTRSKESLALEARVMSRLKCVNNDKVAYSWVTDADFEETGAAPEEAEHLPEAVRVVSGIEVAVLLRQRGTEVRGNLRAKGTFDVSAVAHQLGGGGHVAASGFTVEDSTIDAVLARLLRMLPGGEAA